MLNEYENVSLACDIMKFRVISYLLQIYCVKNVNILQLLSINPVAFLKYAQNNQQLFITTYPYVFIVPWLKASKQ